MIGTSSEGTRKVDVDDGEETVDYTINAALFLYN